MKNISISVFFPAYNESENIERAVMTARTTLDKITDRYEIIIVNDGSRDNTGEIINRLASLDNKLRVVHHPKNLGYGDALWTGIQSARNDWFFFTDADLQFDFEEINKLIKHIPEYRVVLGYRAPRRDSFMRLVNAWGWNVLVRMMFGLKVRDIDCAFKLFDRKILATLPLLTRGATMSAEILIRLMHNGEKWIEVPVSHFPRKFGSPTGAKISVIVRAFKELLKLYMKGI